MPQMRETVFLEELVLEEHMGDQMLALSNAPALERYRTSSDVPAGIE
jgi:hypothetical protein